MNVKLSMMMLGKGWPYILFAIFFLSACISLFFAKTRIKKTNILKYMAGGFIVLSFARALLFSVALYQLWSSVLPSKYLLPPYQPISYFLGYSFTHYFASFLLTLCTALFLGGIFFFLGRIRAGLFLPGDIALFFIGAFLVRWPLILPYVGAVFTAGVLILLADRFIMKRERRLILGPFFLFSAFPFLLFGNALISFFGMQSLVMPF